VFPLKNPFEKMGLIAGDTRETPHATFEQLTTFRAKAIEMGNPSLATAAMMGWELLQRKAHIFVRFEVQHYRPADRPNHIYVINWKTGTGEWEPLFDDNGDPLYPTLIRELDEIKAKRPTGGLMLRRDGTGRSWVGKDEQLTQVERKCRQIIDVAGLPPVIDADGEPQKLTFTSFGRHGGATESMGSGLTELELMKKGQWSSTKAMGNYLHGNDEGKRVMQLKRIKKRGKTAC
jgi:hypothetical protein